MLLFTEPYKYPFGESLSEIVINQLISRAKKSIRIMIFDIDSSKIIKNLLNKKSENIEIKMVIDEKNTPETIKDILIQKNFIIPYKNSKYMHHKIIIIDDVYLITGSANFTINCLYFNNNDLIIFSKEKLTFLKQYIEKVKKDRNYKINYDRNLNENNLKLEIKKIIDYFIWYFDLFQNIETLKNNLFQYEKEFSINRKKLRIFFTKFIYKDKNNNFYEVNDVIKEYLQNVSNRIGFIYSTFTNFDIANLIIERVKNQKILFFGIIESLNSGSKYSTYSLFEEQNMNIFKDKNEGIMHHKFIVLDNNLLTGSYAIADRTNKISSKKYNDDLMFVFQDSILADIYFNYIKYLLDNYF
ncbi:MAG: phospholipase D-like domain-containing protein [Spirochaetes bacterium]|nr:phospholipase D-like domain-containing protein [Spirochaetota bacterium]